MNEEVLQTSRCTQNWSFVVCVHIAAQYELRPKAAVPAGAGAGFTNQPLHAKLELCGLRSHCCAI
jgi:hypothetical protein